MLYGHAGLLAFLPPLFMLAGAARLARRSALPGVFGILHGLAVNLFFLSILTDMVGRRLNPALEGVPGGMLASRAVDLATAWMGPLPAYLASLLGFLLSLAVFTGWDLAGDLASVPVRIPVPRPRQGPAGAAREQPSASPRSEGHGWGREREQGAPPLVPGFLSGVPDDARESEIPLRRHVEQAVEPVRRTPEPPAAAAEPRAVEEADGEETPPGVLPPESLLVSTPASSRTGMTDAEIRSTSDLLVRKLAEFGVVCEMSAHTTGPVLTRFELRPGPGVKVNSIVGRTDDLALALKAKRIRILAPIPGRDAVGIEIPNPSPQTVHLLDVLGSVRGEILPAALGRRMEGDPFVTDIATMPHLLVAGATGTGKSICLHSILCTILMRKRPDEVRIALIDPKKGAEMSSYGDLPHLWAPVVCDAKQARLLLEDLVREMDDRYQRFSRCGARSIGEYNREMSRTGEGRPLPWVILIIDELADLMAVASSEIEQPIARLAQAARAAGIHLVVATQRPSVDVITGVIKANFPCRIAFMVGSKTDSRTILDMNGAEMLLGRGDMLFSASAPEPVRIQGSLVTGREIRAVVDHWNSQDLPYSYVYDPESPVAGNNPAEEGLDSDDEVVRKAREIVIRYQLGSTSLLQRRLKVGYARAGRIMDVLEHQGVVGPVRAGKTREVLVSREEAGFIPAGEEGD